MDKCVVEGLGFKIQGLGICDTWSLTVPPFSQGPAGMQALRIAQADLLREKQRTRDRLRAPWRRQERDAQCTGAEPLRPHSQVKMVKKVNIIVNDDYQGC